MKCFAAPVTAYRYRCSGCQGEDVSLWTKEGVEHWRRGREGEAFEVPCGVYQLIKQEPPERTR